MKPCVPMRRASARPLPALDGTPRPAALSCTKGHTSHVQQRPKNPLRRLPDDAHEAHTHLGLVLSELAEQISHLPIPRRHRSRLRRVDSAELLTRHRVDGREVPHQVRTDPAIRCVERAGVEQPARNGAVLSAAERLRCDIAGLLLCNSARLLRGRARAVEPALERVHPELLEPNRTVEHLLLLLAQLVEQIDRRACAARSEEQVLGTAEAKRTEEAHVTPSACAEASRTPWTSRFPPP